MIAFASSLDQAGVLARSAEDCALLLGAMSGFDPRDSTSAERPPQDFHAALAQTPRRRLGGQPLHGLRIGVPKEFFPAALASDVESDAARRARRAGAPRRDARSTCSCRAPSFRSRSTT